MSENKKSPWGSNNGSNSGNNNGNKNDNNNDDIVKILFDTINKKKENNNKDIFDGFNFSKKFIYLIILGLLGAWGVSGYYKVDVSQQSVELLFGKVDEIKNPGLRWHWPYPIEKVKIVDVTTIRTEEIGYRNKQKSNRRFSFNSRNQVKANDYSYESIMLTGDENIIEVHAEVQWRVKDPYKFLFNIRDNYGDSTVKSSAESALRATIGNNKISTIMSDGRYEIEQSSKELLQKILDSYESGIEIFRLQLLKADPPSKVIDAYRDVQTAKADKEKMINQAKAYFSDVVPKAEGEAEKILLTAQAYAESKIADAEGKASRFNSILNEYKKAKDVTKKRIYIETIEEILKQIDEKIIMDSSSNKAGVLPYLPLNSKRN